MEKDQLELGKKIEQEHKPTYDKIKAYYKEHKKFPAFEEVTTWISEDHLEEFKKYYDALLKMEDYLKKQIEAEDKKPIKEANEPADVDMEVAVDKEVPEDTLTLIELKREFQNILDSIEDILKETDYLNAAPVGLKLSERLNGISKALKGMRDQLEPATKIVMENEEVREPEPREKEPEEDPERKPEDKDKQVLFGNVEFSKGDVADILEADYNIQDKIGKLKESKGHWVIKERNPFRENSNAPTSYKFGVFFDDNHLEVHPETIDRHSMKLASLLEKNIYEDLSKTKKALNESFSIPTYNAEENKAANEKLIQVLKGLFFNVGKINYERYGEQEQNKFDPSKISLNESFEWRKEPVWFNITEGENQLVELLGVEFVETYKMSPDKEVSLIKEEWKKINLNEKYVIPNEEARQLLNSIFTKTFKEGEKVKRNLESSQDNFYYKFNK
jgi:hypothetical protein